MGETSDGEVISETNNPSGAVSEALALLEGTRHPYQ